MPIKVYHPAHGFVLTNDQAEADLLVFNGGKIVIKNREAFKNEAEERKEAAKTKILSESRPILHIRR